jgi:hypothetical protein
MMMREKITIKEAYYIKLGIAHERDAYLALSIKGVQDKSSVVIGYDHAVPHDQCPPGNDIDAWQDFYSAHSKKIICAIFKGLLYGS